MLDPYEDLRLQVHARVDDLLSQMNMKEKAGMMLINTLNAEASKVLSVCAVHYINEKNDLLYI